MDESVDVIEFVIYRSCSKAALISCDQCNIFYHLDCLDPPLTAPPTGYWLCPIHPQHFVVKYFHYLNKVTKFLKFFLCCTALDARSKGFDFCGAHSTKKGIFLQTIW